MVTRVVMGWSPYSCARCSHRNLMAYVEQSKALSRKDKPIASLQSNKDEQNNYVKLRKLVDAEK
jgi:hypothetical protein